MKTLSQRIQHATYTPLYYSGFLDTTTNDYFLVFPQIPLMLDSNDANLALAWQRQYNFYPIDVNLTKRQYKQQRRLTLENTVTLLTDLYPSFTNIKYTRDIQSQYFRTQRVLAHYNPSVNPLPEGVDVTELINQSLLRQVC